MGIELAVTKESPNDYATVCKIVIKYVLFTVCGLCVTLSMTSLFPATKTIIISDCAPTMRGRIIQARLLVNDEGNLGVNMGGFLKCFRVNSSKIGVTKFMDEEFKYVKCPGKKKIFTNDSDGFARTALASVPGSGNTWVRHLIEELTGYYTGSFYHAKKLMPFFKGENTTQNVIVVKTHRQVETNLKRFDKAVLIVRDPFDAFFAEFNRKCTMSKTGIVPREQFEYRRFQQQLRGDLDEWFIFYSTWIKEFPGPIFVIFYDKLKSDLIDTLAKLAVFLGTDVSLRDLWCVNETREGKFHRPPKPAWMSRSNFVDRDLEHDILTKKLTLYELCQNSRVKTNL